MKRLRVPSTVADAAAAILRYEEQVLSRWPEIFVGCLAFVLIVIGIVTWRCCVARRRRRAREAAHAAAMGISPNGGNGGGQQYKVLQGQASDMNLHEMSAKPQYGNDPYAYSKNV